MYKSVFWVHWRIFGKFQQSDSDVGLKKKKKKEKKQKKHKKHKKNTSRQDSEVSMCSRSAELEQTWKYPQLK